MNVVTLGARIKKEASKNFKLHEKLAKELQQETSITYNECIEQATEFAVNSFIIGQTTVNRMKERALELGLFPEKTTTTYFITIRPDTTKTTFSEFYNDVKRFISRKCFVSFTLSFEQKGTTTETLGHGYHVHIVAKMKQRSKGQVLRDTQSTFQHTTANNCIDVSMCHNPEQHVQRYLIDYESKDEHKIETKEWDTIWRTTNDLQATYIDELPTSLSSPGRLVEFL